MVEIVKGNLLDAEEEMICHQVNTRGVMGSSKDVRRTTNVATQLRAKYGDDLFLPYREYCITNTYNAVGQILVVRMRDGKYINNMFGQGDYGYDKKQYTNYHGLKRCLENTIKFCRKHGVKTLAMPYMIGCNRGGGNWADVLGMLYECFEELTDIKLVIYRL